MKEYNPYRPEPPMTTPEAQRLASQVDRSLGGREPGARASPRPTTPSVVPDRDLGLDRPAVRFLRTNSSPWARDVVGCITCQEPKLANDGRGTHQKHYDLCHNCSETNGNQVTLGLHGISNAAQLSRREAMAEKVDEFWIRAKREAHYDTAEYTLTRDPEWLTTIRESRRISKWDDSTERLASDLHFAIRNFRRSEDELERLRGRTLQDGEGYDGTFTEADGVAEAGGSQANWTEYARRERLGPLRQHRSAQPSLSLPEISARRNPIAGLEVDRVAFAGEVTALDGTNLAFRRHAYSEVRFERSTVINGRTPEAADPGAGMEAPVAAADSPPGPRREWVTIRGHTYDAIEPDPRFAGDYEAALHENHTRELQRRQTYRFVRDRTEHIQDPVIRDAVQQKMLEAWDGRMDRALQTPAEGRSLQDRLRHALDLDNQPSFSSPGTQRSPRMLDADGHVALDRLVGELTAYHREAAATARESCQPAKADYHDRRADAIRDSLIGSFNPQRESRDHIRHTGVDEGRDRGYGLMSVHVRRTHEWLVAQGVPRETVDVFLPELNPAREIIEPARGKTLLERHLDEIRTLGTKARIRAAFEEYRTEPRWARVVEQYRVELADAPRPNADLRVHTTEAGTVSVSSRSAGRRPERGAPDEWPIVLTVRENNTAGAEVGSIRIAENGQVSVGAPAGTTLTPEREMLLRTLAKDFDRSLAPSIDRAPLVSAPTSTDEVVLKNFQIHLQSLELRQTLSAALGRSQDHVRTLDVLQRAEDRTLHASRNLETTLDQTLQDPHRGRKHVATLSTDGKLALARQMIDDPRSVTVFGPPVAGASARRSDARMAEVGQWLKRLAGAEQDLAAKIERTGAQYGQPLDSAATPAERLNRVREAVRGANDQALAEVRDARHGLAELGRIPDRLHLQEQWDSLTPAGQQSMLKQLPQIEGLLDGTRRGVSHTPPAPSR